MEHIDRCIAIEAIVALRLKKLGLPEFEPQARLAAANQFNREPSSAHRAITAGVECAKRYAEKFLGKN